jgi:hypothetical protein
VDVVNGKSKHRCFVLMPFRQEFDELYEDSIKPTVAALPGSWECVRADEIRGSRAFLDDINEQIDGATAIIADLTTGNPNVLYEVGIVHRAGKPVILITQSMDYVPSDLKSLRCIVYRFTPRGVKELEETLGENLLEIVEKPSQFAMRQPQPEPLSAGPAARETEVDDEDIYRITAEKYGFGYNRGVLTCVIDGDGNAAFVREMQIEAHTTVEEMNFYLIFPESTDVSEEPIAPPEVESLTPGYSLKPDARSTNNRYYTRFEIEPPLPSGKTLEYIFTERTRKPLYAPDKSKIGTTPWDYYAWDITRPTKRLEVLVTFPVGFRPDRPAHDVWYSIGQSQTRNPAEYNRVRPFLKSEKIGALETLKLSVDYPVLGLTYVIRWEPPDPN